MRKNNGNVFRKKAKIFITFGPEKWRAAGVVDRGRLEICCTLRGTGGSNPSLSAEIKKSRLFTGFFIV